MRLIFNDATELQIQSAASQDDGSLMIKTISATESELVEMFRDPLKTKKMVVKERESVLAEFTNYTELDGIMKYTAGILGVVLFKSGETLVERMETLVRENAQLQTELTGLKESNELLQGCILEMSELVYQ